ncbi:hypothetical protein KUTeg_019574 [Tegillarca granosa]|uniref:CD80-like immunoglobulin C2-set domain-containing protein n=1 Tax=Tegillarca granosa TaxID=220873 RepID=A0ABQ9EIZ2_TEGGR|nr:hypothetical protein KUTeg_019574 [Tegillarca granosa]
MNQVHSRTERKKRRFKMKTNIYDTLALPWLCLVFTANYGMSEVDFTVVDFDPTSTVILPCSADADRVVWLDSSRAPVVELRNNKEISHRNRFYLTRSYGYEKNLKIEMVKKQDGDEAEMAQSSNSSNDVKEFSTVRLWCNATGMPEPKTTWYVLDESGKEQPLDSPEVDISLDEPEENY